MNSPVDSTTIFARVRDLPALPQALVDLMTALQRDDVAVDEIGMRIERDQALTAKTLRLANCSFYGVAGRVRSIRDAVNVLGMRTLGSALAAAAVSGSFALRECPAFNLKAYWRHSMATGLCARALAEIVELDGSDAFIAGLLHDIGQLALVAQFPSTAESVLAYKSRHDIPMSEAELHVLGIDHASIGSLVAAHWHFAPVVVDAIARHHRPGAGATATMSDIVHVADNIVHALDLTGAADELVPPLSASAWSRLALTPGQCVAVFEGTEGSLDELCEALGV